MRRIALLFLCLLALQAPAAEAKDPKTSCQCLPQPLDWRWKNADAVFTGTITKIETVKEWVQRGNDDVPVKVLIRIDEGFKAVEKGKKFLLHTNIQKYTCTGHPYEEGKQYLVFAYGRKAEAYESWSLYDFPSDTYDVGGLCGGMKLLGSEEAASEVEILKSKPKSNDMLDDRDGIIGLEPDKPSSAH